MDKEVRLLSTTTKISAKKNAAPPAQKLSANSRESILAASLKAFACDGFDGASLPKIARTAKVAHPLIHYHFGTKEKLWKETIEYSLGDLLRQAHALRSASRGLLPLDRLRVLLQAFTHFSARCPDHFSMIMAEARSKSSRFTWLQKNYGNAFLEDLASILKEAQESGQIRDVALDQVSFILVGAVLLYFTVNPWLPKNVDIEVQADQFAELLLDMLLNGLSPKISAHK